MIDDVLFDMLDDYNFDMFYDYSFERIFRNYFHFPQKRIVLTVRLRLLTFRYQVSTICYKIFYALRFEMIYDFHLQMSRVKFSSTELFSSGEPQMFYWRKYNYYYYFRTQLFTQGLVPILAFKYNFWRKETVCYVRF